MILAQVSRRGGIDASVEPWNNYRWKFAYASPLFELSLVLVRFDRVASSS